MKISIVVATHNVSSAIYRLDDSIRNQTMPQECFEVIYSDDGSTDDTVSYLEAIAECYPNTRVLVGENSGWPCRPRNRGIEAAVGEYIAFMDDDDLFYPQALEAAYALAKTANADIVNPKESHSKKPSWSLERYRSNELNAIDQRAPFALQALNPRKLYRRSFLNENGIRFLDIGKRVSTEDALFNMEAFGRARVVSVLADTPYSQWVRDDAPSVSNSTPWELIERYEGHERVLEAAREHLSGGRLEAALLYMSRMRVAGHFGPGFAAHPVERRNEELELMQKHVATHIPEYLDQELTGSFRSRMWLFRNGKHDELQELARWDE